MVRFVTASVAAAALAFVSRGYRSATATAASSCLGSSGYGGFGIDAVNFGGSGASTTSRIARGYRKPRARLNTYTGMSGRRRRSSSIIGRGVSTGDRRVALEVRGGGAVTSDPYHARMQVMITRNMRKVLLEDLDYLADEVDDMDPQIAAVVIEKSLPRPRAGMPIAWRKSIRHKQPSSNPMSSLAGAVQGAVGAGLKGVAALMALPLRAVGAFRNGGVKGAVVMVAVVVAVITSLDNGESRERQTSAGSLLGQKLNDIKALWPRRVGSNSDNPSTDNNSGNSSDSGGTKARGLADSSAASRSRWFAGTGRNADKKGGSSDKASGLKAAGDTGMDRSRPLEPKMPPVRKSPQSTMPPTAKKHKATSGKQYYTGDDNSYSGSRERRKFDEFSARQSNDDLDGWEGEGNEGDLAAAAAAAAAAPSVGGRRSGGDAAPSRKTGSAGGSSASQGRVGSKGMAAADEGFLEKLAPSGSRDSGEGSGAVDRRKTRARASSGKRSPKRGMRGSKRKGGTEVDPENEVCPDVQISPNAAGAVWFEDLPPAPPAPSTLGVLDEDEGEGGEGMTDERPRWGRKPLSEHIPSEEEMETWDSKMEPSETWLDRGINKAMGSVFGWGKDDGA